jgi:glycosyltransferase involved in cell wall biosynthesis
VNILFVHEIDWLRKVVFEIHTLSELLSLRGHSVYAIDYESMWERNTTFDFGTLKTKEVEGIARAYRDASVSLIRPGFVKIPGISRLSAACTHRRVIRRIIREKAIDVVILYSVPTNGLQTLSAARKYGVPVIFRSIDILHELVPFSLLAPVTRFVEKKVYTGADMVLTISPRLSGYVSDAGTPKERIRLLNLGVDTDMFRPAEDEPALRQQWGLGDGPVIVFIGTLFEFSGLDNYIRQFPDILHKVPSARLLIVGDGPQRTYLEKIINELGLEKSIVITGFQPYEDMPRYINLAAVCINTFLMTDTTRDIFPTKIVQYLACGKPVLATPLPGIKASVEGEGQGIVYSELDDMGRETVSLLESEERRRKTGQAALKYAVQAHGYDSIVQQLEEILAQVVAGGKKG